ncbi:hypothetical protein AAG570_001496 [Ranatra chinensis]|uniref:Uncharacterized protein n=1 Tax=Ranatra chinensis TaxID=642074 RepID=A0ABD0Y8N7_9HEMI
MASSLDIYYINKCFNLFSHQIPVRLTESPSSVRSGGKPSDRRRLQGAWWCGNTTSLVLVSNNDLYFRNSPAEQIDHRITFNGEPDILYNGVPDWLYQEEILGGDRSCAWCSDDGSHLMYTQFNDTLVRTFAYPWLGVNSPQSNKRPSTFPTTTTVRYPTPGTPNPTVRLLLANLTDLDQPHIELKPPPIFDNQEYYLTSAGWVNRENTKISAVWINRSQNVSVISYCVAPDWICRETHSERAAENGWIDIQSHPVFSEDGGSFLVMAQVQEGSHETRPGQKHMYVVKDPATDEPLRTQPECITCDLNHYLKHSAHLYTNCTYFSAFIPPLLFNDGVTRYVLECDGPGLPVAGVHNSYDHRLVRQLFSSRAELGERLAELALPKQRTFEVPLAHGNRAQVQLLLPPSWREELRDAAYPVLVHIDGRPGSESVSERYNIDWGTYMSSRFDIVYVKLDVGGSIGRGSKAINRRVGSTSQLQHYLTAIRYLLDKHKFFDRTRIAVWGRGYGGYITIRALSSQHTLFKCGIAISPIAEWLYYNSAFTERILGLPSDNYKLYVEADAFQRTKHIENMALYLVHGLADISVPYVHSAALTTSLTDQGVLFRYQSYADQGHDLTGVLEHLYKSMEEFLSQCLNLDRNE